MKTSKTLFVFNHLFYVLFNLILVIILKETSNVLLFVVFILYQLFLFKKAKSLILISLLFGLAFLAIDHSQLKRIKAEKPAESLRCEVQTIPIVDEIQSKFYCKNSQGKWLIRVIDPSEKVAIGDHLKISGSFLEAEQNTVPQLFNYKNYLLSKQVYYIVTAKELAVVKHSEKWRFKVIDSLFQRYQGNLSSYQLSLLIGFKQGFDDDTLEHYQNLNISHLIVVSGFHVATLALMLKKLLRPLKITKERREIIILSILWIYLVLNNFQTSILRAVLFYFGIRLKTTYRIPISNLNLLALICLSNLLVNPFIRYDAGFQLSYLITFILIISSKIIVEYSRSSLMNMINTSLVAQAFSLPIIANFTFRYHFFSLLTAPFLMVYFTFIIFPFTLLSLIIRPIEQWGFWLFALYEKTILILSKVSFFTWTVGAFDITRLVLYFVLLVIMMRRLESHQKIKKYFFLFLILIFTYHKWTVSQSVAYIDVGQGDSAVIQTSLNRCTMMIDTGGIVFGNSSYHPGERQVVPYLLSKQITQLDFLIISHGDSDHAGDYLFVLKQIKVKTIVLSSFDTSDLKQEIIAEATKRKIAVFEMKAGDAFACGPVKVAVISPAKKYQTVNDQSLVLYFKLKKDAFLFTGDISTEVEKELLKKYPSKINFLKVAHHGSKTSTGELWLREQTIQHAIISVGENNPYHHPTPEVVGRLEDQQIKLHLTKNDGTIIIKYFFFKRVIKHTI